MAKTVPFSEARAHLTDLLDEVETLHEHIQITRNGRPAAVVMAMDEYDSLLETLEILMDPDAMADLEASDEDVRAGRVVDLETVKRERGLA